jgi:transcriptional regulator with XRE-family HTH domain
MDNGFNVSIRRLRREKRDRGIVYRAIRAMKGLSQSQMARYMGTTKDAIVRREVTKRVYSIIELVELQRISGLSDTEWCDMLRDIAK